MTFLPKERRFAAVVNRFVWEKPAEGTVRKSWERRRAGSPFRPRAAPPARSASTAAIGRRPMLDLLAIAFEERRRAGRHGHPDLRRRRRRSRLDVECIEAQIADFGPAWATTCCPQHDLEGAEPETVKARP